MQSFTLIEAASANAAARACGADPRRTKYIAGGTDLLQLMKNNVEAPRLLVDLDPVPMRAITVTPQGLRLGALATMAEVGENEAVRRQWPVISEALLSAASPQVRNMGTMGGNLLQRTRCGYFRDTGFACNKRVPGSGCPAIGGENRMLAVLGGSAHCIATQPSDMPVALVALDASVELRDAHDRTRTLPLREFYRLPGDTPQIETNMAPGELITAILVPASAAARRSTYVKVRDRQSFEFAVVSAAAGIELEDGVVRDVRVAMGGVGTVPWRMDDVEAALRGRRASDTAFRAAAERAAEGAQPGDRTGFKIKLMQRTVYRALQAVAA